MNLFCLQYFIMQPASWSEAIRGSSTLWLTSLFTVLAVTSSHFLMTLYLIDALLFQTKKNQPDLNLKMKEKLC